MCLDVEALYREHFGTICRYIQVRLGRCDPAVADDLASEVFLLVWRKRHLYREMPGIPPVVWVKTIARHRLADAFRAARPATSLEVLLADGFDPVVPDPTDTITDSLDLADAIRQLPPRQQAVIVRQFYGGERQRDLGDISTLYGIKEIRKRAVANLRKALGAA